MRERREQGGSIDALRTATTKQVGQVAAVRAALGQLREGIWSSDEAPTDS